LQFRNREGHDFSHADRMHHRSGFSRWVRFCSIILPA
jgi:hypothetical protein